MKLIVSILLFQFFLQLNAQNVTIIESENPNKGNTVITTKDVSATSKIVHKILRKPHNLLIGRCDPRHQILHQEHIQLKNDGKSHVEANIRINVEGPVRITCVSILDENIEQNAYPLYSDGGVNRNFVAFNVITDYGEGFHFFVRILGEPENP